MAGRRSKLTPERQQRLIDAIKAGNYVNTACDYAGIGVSTFYEWMNKGEGATRGKYREFADAIKRAMSEAEVYAVAIVKQSMKDDWRAAMTYLERRHPDRWGRRVQEQQHSGKIEFVVVYDDDEDNDAD